MDVRISDRNDTYLGTQSRNLSARGDDRSFAPRWGGFDRRTGQSARCRNVRIASSNVTSTNASVHTIIAPLGTDNGVNGVS